MVTQAFAFAGASYQACDVHKLYDGRHDALGVDDFGQVLQTRIGDFYHAHVGLNGAEGVVFGGDAGFGEGVKQGGFAHVGQAHDTAFQAHGWFSLYILSSATQCGVAETVILPLLP